MNYPGGHQMVDLTGIEFTNTGAYDGKVYGFIGLNSAVFNVTTDDSNVTFTPA